MSGEGHRHFHDELARVKVRLLTMSGEAEAALGLAVEALFERDREKARRVIAGDTVLDAMEVGLEEACINLLATQQPMARDLRMLTSALKIASDLERVGDHAVNVAQSAERLLDARPLDPLPELVVMARVAREMLADALEAFIRGDAGAARATCRRDDEVDALHRSMFRILLTHMMEDPHLIGAGMELFLVSRNLERVADLATNIAEDVVFLVEGKTIKHHAEELPGVGGRAGVTLPGAAGRDRLAAIDVGSHSIRLLVAEVDPAGGLSVIDEVKDHPRLAAGLAATGRLDPGAMDAAVAALRRMHEVCLRRGVRRIAAVATSAVREAENGAEFVHRVQAELGIPLRIVDGATEAQLSYRSVAHHFRLQGERTLIVDIGGGSLELVGAVDGVVELNLSLPLGAVRLTEEHLGARPSWRDVEALRRRVRKQLRKAFDAAVWSGAAVIGSGGTFTNLGRMAIARRGTPIPDAVHGTTVVTGEVEALLEWLATKVPEERATVPGLSPYRADIILAGLAVTAELLELVNARKVTVSAFGLREGLLLEMAGAGGDPGSQDPLRLVREFAERCQTDRRHVEQVRVLALQLLDQLGPALGCEPGDRPLLEAASLLHDVGQLVSYRRHHKHSYQLIMNAERLNLSARDRTIVALVSRYHRKRGPTRKHPEFAGLAPEDQAVVRRLSGILRVADGLDRGHTAIVERVEAELDDDRCTLRVTPRLPDADLSLEAWGAERKKEVLEKGLGREVRIVQG